MTTATTATTAAGKPENRTNTSVALTFNKTEKCPTIITSGEDVEQQGKSENQQER
ncbi:hypothetical protein Hanom_Chr06g00484071 [Helianthus anomalus]